MAQKSPSIPIAAWWFEAVRREMKDMSQVKLAELVDDIPANVSRCLSGQAPTLRLIVAISDKLNVPRPVWLPQSESEALLIKGAVGRFHIDMERAAMERDAALARKDADEEPPSGKRIRKP